MKSKGISLIVLIITIIVIIILSGAVILNLSKNNPIESAKKAKFQSDIDTFKSELSLYVLGKSSNTEGNYDPKLLNADKGGSTENGSQTIDTTRPITEIISSMKGTKYDEKLKVEAGELVYIGDNIAESNWADGLIEVKGFSINVALTPGDTHIAGTISITGALVDISKLESCKIYLSEESGKRSDTPAVTIAAQDLKSEMAFDITNGVEPYKTYYVIVDVKMSNEGSVRTKEIKVISSLDNSAPQKPQISKPEYSKDLIVSPIAITLKDNNGESGINKTGSKYIIDQTLTNYEEDDVIWNTATGLTLENFAGDTATIAKEVPSDGAYYIHVLAVDNAGNKSSNTSSKVIVDTIVPNEAEITIPANTATNNVQATVKLSDNTNGSGIDLSNCKYIYSTVTLPYGDTETIWDSAIAFTSETQVITVTSSTDEVHYLHVLLVDRAGNRREVLSSGVTTNTSTPVAPSITGTVATNVWTKDDVTLTVGTVASPGITKYEYIINGGEWQTYNSTNKIVITSEGTSAVKARAVNNVGTLGAESTGYIIKIDKTNPGIILGKDGGKDPIQASTSVNITDAGSGINTSKLQYVWDTQSSTMPSSGWTVFANGSTLTKTGDGSYYLWIKAEDNVGNLVIIATNKFIVGEAEIVSIVQSVNKTFSGATSGYSYNNPVIPAGFVAVNTDDASWNELSTDWDKGLVIQDQYGNQFVWVPVDGTNVKYENDFSYPSQYGATSSNTTDDTLPSGFSVSNITSTYKGFYIARYESMFDYNGGNIRTASRKSMYATDWPIIKNAAYDGYLWNYINYTDAKIYSENMAAAYGYNTSLIGTNLITGNEWDTAMKWIKNSNKSVINSRNWGNHRNASSPANISGYGKLQISGYTNYWKAKNIYDLAGNLQELTNEKADIASGSGVVSRSGSYVGAGDDTPVAYRLFYNVTNTSGNLGFRVALYIK